MRKVIIECEVYKFNELDEYAKENVRQWYLDHMDADAFTENCEEDLKCLFGKDNDLKVQYSLNSCQGDGFNIYGYINAKDIIDCLKSKADGNQFNCYRDWMTEEENESVIDYAEKCGKIKLPKNTSYCYCMADYIYFTEDWVYELKYEYGYKEEDIKIDAIYKFESMVSAIFESLCKDYEKSGYEYFYELSDEDLEEVCDVMGYEFYEDGKIFNG